MDRCPPLVILVSALLLVGACSDNKRGFSSITTQSAIAVLDPVCPFGGNLVSTGTDVNRDGVLTSNEITSQSPVCNTANSPGVDAELRKTLSDRSITANPAAGRTIPSINTPLAQLGMQLFFTKGLGGDQDSACVTCHHPFLGGGDDMTLSVGVHAVESDLLGPGREHSALANGFDGGPTVPRNAPTTFNIALWDKALFHDGRIESLTKIAGTNGSDRQIRTPDVAFGQVDPASLPNLTVAQIRFPVTSPEEMRGFTFEAGQSNAAVRNHLAARLQGNTTPPELGTNNWLQAFRTGFQDPAGAATTLITYENVSLAIAAYESSQTFVNTPFKRFIDGDDTAMSGDAKLGALLFYGRAGCAGCHSGDFMSDEEFHVLAMPQVGRGKGNNNGANSNDDFGRFRETGVAADRYAFRTPSLLNVAETGPWSHAGAYSTLEAVIRHHADPHGSVQDYDFNQVDAGVQTGNMLVNTGFALDQLDALRAAGTSRLPVISLSDTDVGRLVEFMHALTDDCLGNAQCIGRWVPPVTMTDPDDLRVEAIDRLGNPLTP